MTPADKARYLKHRAVVTTFYTFSMILLCLAAAPLTLLILFSTVAALFGWQVDDGQTYSAMGNAVVLTLILGGITLPVWLIGVVIGAHPPVPLHQNKSGVAPSHDTVTTPLQDQR